MAHTCSLPLNILTDAMRKNVDPSEKIPLFESFDDNLSPQLEATAYATEDVIAEWQAKYDRLFDAHRKLQKTNNSLEDKLLRIVDKFESDKNQMTRDLASQTQKLVQAKLAVQHSRDQNRDLQQESSSMPVSLMFLLKSFQVTDT
jgi:hypothetical protein